MKAARKALAILMLLAALFGVSAALADKPVGGWRGLEMPKEQPGGLVSRGVNVYTSKEVYEAGEPIVLNVGMNDGGSFDVDIAVWDGSHPNGVADVIYSTTNITGKTFTYDLCWTPGEYGIWVTVRNPVKTGGGSSLGTGTGSSSSTTRTETSTHVLEFTVTACSGTNQLTQKVKQVVAANRGADDFETLVNLHDWVLANNVYDRSFTYYSAESLFFLGTGVCNSYARAFDLLLREAGIPSRRVGGYLDTSSPDTSGHAWSAAAIDGKWYLYDCTWDDSQAADSYWNYRYCGLPNDLMALDHTVTTIYVGGSVTCSAMDSNYFVRTGRWREECGSAADQMEEQLAAGNHRFVVRTNVNFGGNTDEFYVNNRIAAAGITATEWTDALGDPCSGTFTADKNSANIVGRMEGSGTLTLPNATTTVGAEAFAGTRDNYVFLPGSCTAIESGAFRDSRVWEITMGKGVRSIADDAFDGLPNVLIIAPSGSYAANWATSHGYQTTTQP